MKRVPFDTTGFVLGRAEEILQEAGWQVRSVTRIGPAGSDGRHTREIVVRQTPGEDNSTDLVVAGVWAIARKAETATQA